MIRLRFIIPIVSPLAGALVFVAAAWTGAFAAPGSGTAIITPSADVAAGSAARWSIQYTAAENMKNGQVRVTIPGGWTAPQSGNASAPGYASVTTDQPGGSPLLSIASMTVTIDVDTLTAGNTLTVVYGDDSGGANPSAHAVAPGALGPHSFVLASDPAGTSPASIAASPSLTVIAGPPSYLEVAPSDTTVVAGTFAPYRIIVRDEFGNRTAVPSSRTVSLFPAHGQFFLPADHGTPVTQVSIGAGTTSRRIDYRGTLATAGTPHSIFVITSSGVPVLAGSDDVNIIAAALNTTQSTLSATSPVTANGTSQSSVTVTSKDDFGNPRSGDTVVLGVTGTAVKTDPGGPTGASGQALGVVTNTTAQNVTVSATINAQLITASALVAFVAGPVDAGTSTVEATTPVTANGSSTSTITVTAKDANDNPVAGQSVTLAITPPGSGAVLTQPGGVTNAAGVATGTLSSTSTGPRTVTATVGATPVTDDAVVNFNAGAVASFEWTFAGGATAGVSKQVTLTAKDAQGHVVTDYTGLVNLDTNSSGVGNSVVEWSDVDAQGTITNLTDDAATYQFAAGDNGVALLRITDNKAESIILSASAAGPATGSSSTLIVSPGAPDKVILVAGNGQSANAGSPVSTPPKVRVTDAFDNNVTGATVTFRKLTNAPGAGVDVVAGGGVDSTGTTASDGTIDCDVWTMANLVSDNPNRLRALIASGSIPSVDFTATATAGPGASLVLTPASKNVTVGATQLVTATLTDAFGNPKSGDVVTVVVKSGLNGTLAEGTGTTTPLNPQARQGATSASGVMTVLYQAPVGAGLADVLDASTSTVPQSSVADVTYTTTASGATNLRITFLGPTTRPAGQSSSFKVEAVDGGGNVDTGNTSTVTLTPETLSNIEFSLTDFGATITQAPLIAGTRTFFVRGTKTGDWDITASTGGLSSDTKALNVTDTGSIDHYVVSTVASVTAGVLFNVSVSARDQYDNVVVGANSSFSLTAIDDVTTTPTGKPLLVTGASLSSGAATIGETYTTADAIRVRVSDAGSKEGISNVVTVSAAAAKRIVKVSGDGSGIAAGANRDLTARVLDTYDNPVSGELVSFNVTQGGGSVLPTSGSSNASGDVTTTLTTGVVAGDNRVQASILDGLPPSDERVEFSVVTQAGGIAYFTVVPQQLSLVAGESVSLTVTAYDAGDNVVSSDNTTQVQLSSTGSAEFGAVTGTLSSGVFATTLADTVAESFTVTAEKQGGGPPSGTSASVSVTNAGTYRVEEVSGTGSGITAGSDRVLQARVRDMYGNPVPGAVVTFSVISAPAGTPSFTDADGDPNDGIAVADGNGVAQVTYHTAQTAGLNQVRAQILDGSPPSRERVTFGVSTVAGGISYYTVQMSSPTATAGVSINAIITAFDGNNNQVSDSSTQVSLSGDPGIGLVFGANPVTLSNGGAVTTVTANQVQTYRVRASTQGNPGITGLGPNVVVGPAAPAGTITATATKNTITANGTSTTIITSGVIRDAFTNIVTSGTVSLTAGIGGTILTSNPAPIGVDGRIVFTLQSSTTVGNCTVNMNSVAGSASGSIIIAFAPKPNLAVNTPVPNTVVPGASVPFSVNATNSSATSVDLTTATTFTFSDGVHTFSANLAAPQTVPGSGGVTLAFNSVLIDPAFVTANYAPAVTLVGSDAYGSPVNVVANLPAASLRVTSIEITGIVPEFSTVSRGQSLNVAVTVKNNGADNATISDVDLVFIPADLFTVGTAPEVGATVLGGQSGVFNLPVTVQPGATVQAYQIDAAVAGAVGGAPVTDNSVAPHPLANLNVTSAASLAYEPGTLTPGTVSRGTSYTFQLTIRNNGGGLVLIDSTNTHLEFSDGTRTFSAAPAQPYAIAGGGATQVMNFRMMAVAASFTPGTYPATLDAHGTENGAPFNQAVALTGSPVTVVTPAAIANVASNGLSPDTVSKTTTATFSVQLQNTGGATVVLDPATTTIKFASDAYSATLNPGGPTSLAPGTTTLQFLGAVVSGSIASNTYFPTVQLTGTENGKAFNQSIILNDGVVVQNAPTIAILGMFPSQPQYTQNQTKPIKVRMVVSNTGGAGANFTSATMRFIEGGQDRSNQFVISTPASFSNGVLLSPGEVDTVVFDVSDDLGNSTTVGNMTIEGNLAVEDVNTTLPILANTNLGGKGNLQVMSPAAFSFSGMTVSQAKVTQNMTKQFKVRAIVRNTGSSDAVLTMSNPATRLTFSSPGWAYTLQPTLGNGGATLSGGEVDTLIFTVTTSGSTPGTTTIGAVTEGTETNSGRIVPGTGPSLGSVQVQTAGSIQVTSIVTSQPSITTGTTVPWTATVTINNPGQADIDLSLGGAIGLTILNQSTPPAFTPPVALVGGGITLSGGETDQLVIPLTTSGTYTSVGSKTITAAISGTELNRGVTINSGGSTGIILVQQPPDAAFVSLMPGTVSRLTNVAFAVDISNPVSNSATIVLDRSLTRLRFGSNQFNVGLTQASPVNVAAGAQATLQFTGATVTAGIPLGVQNDAEIELHWTHNGVAGTRTIPIPGVINVEDAPSLSILSVRTSKSTMTRNQLNAGTVTMVIQNSGGAAVDLDLSPSVTRLGFKALASGIIVTNEYTVVAPTALEGAGGTILAGGATDSLVFDLTQAGVQTGAIVVNGYLGGIDLNSQLPVTDDTSDGGSGGFDLQLAGILSILSITPSQPTATTGQTAKSYTVRMAVRNTGGAAIDVNLAQPNSAITFVGKSGFVINNAIMPGGNTLSGGETDTLRFTVTTTGGPAGVTAITGVVAGTENNTGDPRNDDTVSGGTGTITLQTPAVIVIDSVTPSRPSVTSGTSVGWNTTIALRNTGQSAANLNLPSGFFIALQNDGGTTSFVKPVNLLEGGFLLPGGASGTLVAHANNTGTVVPLGNRQIQVSVGATEVNSNRTFSQGANGSILVQSSPDLVVANVSPVIVTTGSLIGFDVDVQNPLATNATVKFNRGTTRVHFASQAYSAFLDVASPDSIIGGQTVKLRFEGKVVSTSIPVAPDYDFNVNLNYAANGVTRSEPEVLDSLITVQSAPQLAIQQIVVSQPTVTVLQGRNWTATMTVMNNGSADIDLSLLPANTYLSFIGPDLLPDNSYLVNPPTMPSGDEILLPGESDQIVFTIDQTGTKTGNIVITGRVQGTDLNQQSTVIDDTFDGGRGSIIVQTPAQVAVIGVHPSQPSVTVGQGGFDIRVVLANTGGADVALTVSGTDVSYDRPQGWANAPTLPLAGGGNILEAGSVDSLIVPVYEAGDNFGLTRMDATAIWTEINSQTPGNYDTEITDTGYGYILNESPADIRITTTTSAAPNLSEVNVGQTFNVQVQVRNGGGADAKSVVVQLATNGGSTILPVAPLAVAPGGGQTTSYLLPVQAAGSPSASETFTATLVSALDENSGVDSLVTISTPQDNTAAVAVQTPATLEITNVRPSQPSVTRSQASPWNVIVALRNSGQADANITPPAASDLGFSLGGATKIDYIVQAPAQFGSGTAGWTLPGGATDSLLYTVVSTGDDPGVVDITAGTAGTDRNDPPQTLSDNGATTVTVQDVAGLFIASTVPVGTFNHASAARDTVNTSFNYEIHVTVQNSGGEDVDSVLVQLAKDGNSVVSPASFRKVSIAAAASHEFVFRIAAPPTPSPLGTFETFTSSIAPGVKSHNTGLPIIPQTPLDNAHTVVAQTRANLSMDLFISSPPGSAGGVVSPSQAFTIAARVANLGQARITGPANVTLAVPGGFTVQENLVRAFAANDTVRWSVTAPASQQPAVDFSCAISTPPNDVNTSAVAVISNPSDTQSVTVSTGGALASPGLVVLSPAGAVDDTLSVSQNFTVRASITPTSDTKSVVATLTLPAGFSIVNGSLIRNLGNGPGTKTADYNLIAPSSTAAAAMLRVTFTGEDVNSGDPVPSAADTLYATVVPRTSLSVAAAVTAPPDAVDNTVAVATPFTVTAAVSNVVGAADIAAPGNLQITLPSGYTLASGQTAVKSFVAGVPVDWVVNAPSQPSGPNQITVAISTVPADENSGQPALVTTGAANIAMVTEGAAVSVRDVSSSLQVGTGVAPGGAANLDVLAFEIAYNVTDPNVSPAEVDTIALTIIDRDGNTLGASVVGQTLARLAVDLGGSQPYEIVNPNTNPVLISLVGGGTDRQIAPNASINAIVLLDLDASPRATEFRVRLRGGGMVVQDPGSGQALGVTDTQGRPLDGQITSAPLVIRASNFEEYAYNYPNPFRAGSSETKIAYFLDAPSNITVRIFDITGELVHEESIPSSDSRAQPGPQATTWDGRNGKGEIVRNGLYVCVLNAGSHSAKFRIAVAK